MPCQTCDHTMQGLGKVESGDRYFFCPRCGTIKAVDPTGREEVSQPKLIEYLHDILPDIAESCGTSEEAKAYGIVSQSFVDFLSKFEGICRDFGWTWFAEQQHAAKVERR